MKKYLNAFLAIVLMLNLFPALAVAEEITMELGVEYEVVISSPEDYQSFVFVPETTGTYVFSSIGECAPEVNLCDDYKLLGYGMSNADGSINVRFEYSYLLAGQTYYFDVFLPFEDSGEFGVMLEHVEEFEPEKEIAGMLVEKRNGLYGISDLFTGHVYYYMPDDSLDGTLQLADRYLFRISSETNTIISAEVVPSFYGKTFGYMTDFEYSEDGHYVRYRIQFEDSAEWYEMSFINVETYEEYVEEFGGYTGMIACYKGEVPIFDMEKLTSPIHSITNAVYNDGFEALEYEITESTQFFNKTSLESLGVNSPISFVNGLSYNVDVVGYDGYEAIAVLVECLDSSQDSENLICGGTVTASVSATEGKQLTFVPPADGLYKFISLSSEEHDVGLFDLTGIEVYTGTDWEDDSDTKKTECVYYNMLANNSYTYQINGYEDCETDFMVSVSVEKVSEGLEDYELIGYTEVRFNEYLRLDVDGSTYYISIDPDSDIDFEQLTDGYVVVSVNKSNQITEIEILPEYYEWEIGYLVGVAVDYWDPYCRILKDDYDTLYFAERVYVDGWRCSSDEIYDLLNGYNGVVAYQTDSLGKIDRIDTEIDWEQNFTGKYVAETNSFMGIEYPITEDTLIFDEKAISSGDDSEFVDGKLYNVRVVGLDRNGNARAIVVSEQGKVSTPVADPAGGELNSDTPVTLSTTTENATIYYSLDDYAYYMYTSPIIIKSDVTLYAIAVKDGMVASDVMIEQYTVKPSTSTSYSKTADGYEFDIECSQDVSDKLMLVAIYDSDGRMLGIKTAIPSGNLSYKATIDTNEIASYAKIFVWGSMSNLIPTVKSETINIAE